MGGGLHSDVPEPGHGLLLQLERQGLFGGQAIFGLRCGCHAGSEEFLLRNQNVLPGPGAGGKSDPPCPRFLDAELFREHFRIQFHIDNQGLVLLDFHKGFLESPVLNFDRQVVFIGLDSQDFVIAFFVGRGPGDGASESRVGQKHIDVADRIALEDGNRPPNARLLFLVHGFCGSDLQLGEEIHGLSEHAEVFASKRGVGGFQIVHLATENIQRVGILGKPQAQDLHGKIVVRSQRLQLFQAVGELLPQVSLHAEKTDMDRYRMQAASLRTPNPARWRIGRHGTTGCGPGRICVPSRSSSFYTTGFANRRGNSSREWPAFSGASPFPNWG